MFITVKIRHIHVEITLNINNIESIWSSEGYTKIKMTSGEVIHINEDKVAFMGRIENVKKLLE